MRECKKGRVETTTKVGHHAATESCNKTGARKSYGLPCILWEEEFEPLVYAASVSCAKLPGAGDVCDIQPNTV